MDKMEEILKSADFSAETDFKDRLRTQLFKNNTPSSVKDDQVSEKRGSKRNRFARELDLDELDLVTAAGDAHYRQKRASFEDVLNPLKDPSDDKI